MQVQYHEFAASIEDEKTSRAAGGKTAYVPCPKGEKSWLVGDGQAGQRHQLRHRRHRHQRQRLGRPQARRLHLLDLGDLARTRSSTCCRASAARRPASRCCRSPRWQAARNRPTTMPNALTFAAVYDFGIKDPNFVLGPEDPGGQRVPPDHPRPGAKVHLGQGHARGSLQGDQAEDRRPERRLIRPTAAATVMADEHPRTVVPRLSAAAGSTVLPAARRLCRARWRADHRLRAAGSSIAPPSRTLLFLADAAGRSSCWPRSRSTRSSGSST